MREEDDKNTSVGEWLGLELSSTIRGIVLVVDVV